MGEPPLILFLSCFCKGVQRPEPTDRPNDSSSSGPANPARSSPVPVEKASSVGAVSGNDNSFTNKADISVTNGINLEYKQEPRQSSQGARPARQGGQPTFLRRIRDNAGQHERGRGTPSHRPTIDRGVRATHQANATPAGSATDPGRP